MQKRLQLTIVANIILLCFNSLGIYFNQNSQFSRQIKSKQLTLLLLLLVSISGYAQLPTETFETGMPATWTLFGNDQAVSEWEITNDAYQGSNAAFINPSADNLGAGNTAQYFLVTPLVTIPDNGEIRFYTKRNTSLENENITYQVRLSTATQPDINGFTVTLQSWDGTNLNEGSQTEYEEKIITIPLSIPSGLDIYIAFVAVNTQTGAVASGDAWYIDNVRLIEGCLLVEEANVAVSGITPAAATISWTHPSETNFEIQVVEQGVSPEDSGEPVNGSSYDAENLDPETTYDIYIKTVCDTETSSTWAGPFSFTTLQLGMLCESPIIITASEGSPFSFDSNLMYYPNADVIIYTTPGTNCLPNAETQNYLLGNKIFLSYTADQDGLINISQMTLPWTQGTECWGNANSGVFIYESCSTIGVECLAGLNTTTTSQPETIENFPVTEGTEYTIVMSSPLAGTATSICFEFDLSFTTCPTPSEFTYENLVQESVMFSWDNPVAIAESWEYVVLPISDPAPTGSGTPTATNENIFIDGLAAGTSYNLYVKPVCDGTPGEWGEPYVFTTQCDVFDTPYSTDFVGSNAENPEPCWASLDLNNDDVKWTYQAGWEDGYLGYATLNTSTNQNFNHDYLVSPQINFDGVQKRLRYSQQVGWGGSMSYSIKISTSGIGEDNFTYELLPETVIINEAWQEVIYNIPENIIGTVNIAWVVSPVGSGHAASKISFTNVYIEDKPICPDPISPVLIDGSVTTDSAQFSWTVGDLENQWEVLVLPLYDPEPTSESSGIIVSGNPYTYDTGLFPATRYKFYVRAYCSDEHQSNWVGPVNFITECTTFTTPFYESFDDLDDNTQKFCWTINNANADASEWVMEATNPELRDGGGWFNPTTGYDDWLISPGIQVNGVKELKFDYRARFSIFHAVSRYGLQVLISHTDTNPASFEELIPLYEFTNTDYVENSVYFEGNGIVYIAFRVPPDFEIGIGTSILDLDNVSITNAPECPAPNSLSAQSILANSANLSWNLGYGETQWEIVVQQAGLGIPTEAGETVDVTSYDADELLSGTDYEFYVRAVCSESSTSEWTGPFTFTTLCDPFNTPFVETFNTDSETEECWRIFNANNDNFNFVTNVTTGTYEGDQAAGMFTGSNGENNDWLVSPTINIVENQRVRFYYRVNSQNFTEDLEIRLSTNGVDLTEFTTILFEWETAPPINNEEYKEMIINFPVGITGNINIAWHIPNEEPSPAGYRGQILIIDNVIVEDVPECPTPYNVTISNITDTSVDVDWDVAGDETQWEVVVQPFGMDAPGATPNPEYTHIADAHPFTVTDLDPAFNYEVYVRAVCTSGAEWTQPIEFNTLCSFENLCEYTITLSGGPSSGIGGGINVIQNDVVVQTLDFPYGAWNEVMEPVDFVLYLCNGVEFSLYWDAVGTAPGQFPGAMVTVTNSEGVVVSATDLGLLPAPRSTFFTDIVACGVVTCPQPTDLTFNELGELSWTAGGTELSWEVFVQPYNNGTLPQSGTIVSTPSYTPQESDFVNGNSNTFEYFVRAVCGDGDESYWSGPMPFIINDDKGNAAILPVNSDNECAESVTATLVGSTSSSDVLACDGLNGGDIWYQFEATSPTHSIQVDNFSGDYYYSSGNEPYAKITMALYEDIGGNLTQIACSSNYAISTLYTSELTVGQIYKLRILLNETTPSTYSFNVCVKTITDACTFEGVNGDFEQPEIEIGLVNNMFSQNVVPGWRYTNISGYWSPGIFFYLDALNTVGITAYDGGQFIQMMSSEAGYAVDLNNMDGLYQDFDSSETTLFDYSFAHSTRGGSNTLKLYVGAPEGPFVEVVESTISTMQWQLREGTYVVPEGQAVTRFVIRAESGAIGNLLDGIKVIANNEILTIDQTLNCDIADVTVAANGVGIWTADENNPGVTAIIDANSNNTSISGFTVSGNYTYHWKTRYCENSVTFTYQAFTDVPTVTSPVVYCLNQTAQPLSATSTYSLLWFTDSVGGTGSTTAPTPLTTSVVSTTYYLANVNAEGCEGPRVPIEVIVNALEVPVVEFSYDNSAYCSNDINPVAIGAIDFTTGGVFTSTAGLVFADNTTGEIDLDASTAGTYTITYTVVTGTCNEGATYAVDITINASFVPVVEFSYDAAEYCVSNANPIIATDPNFTAGGTFTSTPSGLVIDAATGAIDLAGSSAGTYTIVYTVLATDCNSETVSTGTTITITEETVPVVGFAYDAVGYCLMGTNPIITTDPDFTAGGTFTASPSGLVIDATTGAINVAGSSAGTYTIVYTVLAGDCSQGATSPQVEITIEEATAPTIGFEYDASQFCLSDSNPMVILAPDFTIGGEFTATPSGLTIDASTGAIDLSTSQAGTYEITYAVAADITACTSQGSEAFTITVIDGGDIQIIEECDGSMLLLQAVSEIQADAYIWTNENGDVVGTSSETFNVTDYLQNQSAAMLPLTFNVEAVTTNGCSSMGQITITEMPCMEIPRGISPNGDAQNDTFDLHGMRVRNLSIFNRYGLEVYKFSGNYTNQWEGQSNKGDKLPDATYFYSIETEDGNAFTGWVYINR